MSEKRKRNVIIYSLCGVLLLMTIGYAAFNTLLTINGTTSISSNWDIKITNITNKDIVGKASDEESQVVDDLKATFKANLVSPGDSITYDITVENKGNINAELDSIDVSENTNENIKIVTSGIAEGDKLNPSSTATLSVKVTYSDEVTTQPDNLKAEVTITLNYIQEGTGMPETIDFETESTTRAITVTAPAVRGATYEFKKDTEEYVSNDDPTNNIYTFDQITHNTQHNIQVKVTKGSKVIESDVKPVSTNALPSPSITGSGETAYMTFPEECATGVFTCQYRTVTDVSSQNVTRSVTSQSASWTIQVQYVGSDTYGVHGTVYASVSDGFNKVEVSAGLVKQCFVAGTKVWAEKGLVNIEDLKDGDKVYSYNEKTRKVELNEIYNTYNRKTDKLITLRYAKNNKIKPNYNTNNIEEHYNSSSSEEDNIIKCTLTHRFYVVGKGWTPAKKIEVGDEILSIDGSEIIITDIQTNTVKPTAVYNFSVVGNHNYYVGMGLLVHNKYMVGV